MALIKINYRIYKNTIKINITETTCNNATSAMLKGANL